MEKKIRIGARGSLLSRRQVEKVIPLLEKEGYEVECYWIKTEGDKKKDTPLFSFGGEGVFVKQIEEALIKGEIDIAIHSAKDLPTKLPKGLIIGGCLLRDSPYDALVGNFSSWEEVPSSLVVGTASIRRKEFLSYFFPHWKFLPIRGNIDTRIKKWKKGEVDALVLSECALIRLSLSKEIPYLRIPFSYLLPAVGQGIILFEIREDSPYKELLQKITHLPTQEALFIERKLLSKLGGGCFIPLGAYAKYEKEGFSLEAMYLYKGILRRASYQDKDPSTLIEKVYRSLLS